MIVWYYKPCHLQLFSSMEVTALPFHKPLQQYQIHLAWLALNLRVPACATGLWTMWPCAETGTSGIEVIFSAKNTPRQEQYPYGKSDFHVALTWVILCPVWTDPAALEEFLTHSSHWCVNLHPSEPPRVGWLPSHHLLWLCHGWDPAWSQDSVVHLHQVKPSLTQDTRARREGSERAAWGGQQQHWWKQEELEWSKTQKLKNGFAASFLTALSPLPATAHLTWLLGKRASTAFPEITSTFHTGLSKLSQIEAIAQMFIHTQALPPNPLYMFGSGKSGLLGFYMQMLALIFGNVSSFF